MEVHSPTPQIADPSSLPLRLAMHLPPLVHGLVVMAVVGGAVAELVTMWGAKELAVGHLLVEVKPRGQDQKEVEQAGMVPPLATRRLTPL